MGFVFRATAVFGRCIHTVLPLLLLLSTSSMPSELRANCIWNGLYSLKATVVRYCYRTPNTTRAALGPYFWCDGHRCQPFYGYIHRRCLSFSRGWNTDLTFGKTSDRLWVSPAATKPRTSSPAWLKQGAGGHGGCFDVGHVDCII